MYNRGMLLSIAFQFGDFLGTGNPWWYDIMISAVGGLVGIAGAYGIYRHQVRQVREDRLKYVATLLSSIASYCKQTAASCKELSDELRQNPFKFKLLPFQANFDLRRLTERVDQEGFYHAYLWKYGRSESVYRDFKETYGYLDFLHANIEQLLFFIEKEYQGIYRRKNDFKIALDATTEYLQRLLIDPTFRGNHLNYATAFQNILAQYRQNFGDPEDLTYPNRHLVEALSNYINQNIPNAIQDVTELVVRLTRTSDIYGGIEKAGKSFGEDLAGYYEALSKRGSEV